MLGDIDIVKHLAADYTVALAAFLSVHAYLYLSVPTSADSGIATAEEVEADSVGRAKMVELATRRAAVRKSFMVERVVVIVESNYVR